MYGDNEYSSATDFFRNIMTEEDVLPMDILLKKISRAPAPAKNYLERKCRDHRELEEFFKDNDYLFYLENGKIALQDDKYENYSKKAVEYFEAKLKTYGEPVKYTVLKDLEDAPQEVCFFMSRFYPAKEFKKFFKKRSDVFVYHNNQTVFLVEVDCVKFFKDKLKSLEGQRPFFLNFRGHVAQAPRHVQNFMNKHFKGDDFQIFLRRHSDVFRLDEDGFISLVPTI